MKGSELVTIPYAKAYQICIFNDLIFEQLSLFFGFTPCCWMYSISWRFYFFLGRSPSGRAFRCNLFDQRSKRIFTAIPNAVFSR